MNCRTLYTVVRCEAPVRKAGPHRYIALEVLDARGAPRSAKVRLSGCNTIQFCNADYTKEFGKICHHDLMRAAPVILVFHGPACVIVGEVIAGEARYVRGRGWCMLWTIHDNTKTALLVRNERGLA